MPQITRLKIPGLFPQSEDLQGKSSPAPAEKGQWCEPSCGLRLRGEWQGVAPIQHCSFQMLPCGGAFRHFNVRCPAFSGIPQVVSLNHWFRCFNAAASGRICTWSNWFVGGIQASFVRLSSTLECLFCLHATKCKYLRYTISIWVFFLRFYLFLVLDRGEGKEKERKRYINVWLPLKRPPLLGTAYNPGMCPNWDSNWRPFGSQAGTQSTEPHQPGCFFSF